MKRHVLALALLGPLLIQWAPYNSQGQSVDRLVLYRNVNGGTFTAYATIRDLKQTSVSDSQVKWNRRYCYYITAITVDEHESGWSNQSCASPLK